MSIRQWQVGRCSNQAGGHGLVPPYFKTRPNCTRPFPSGVSAFGLKQVGFLRAHPLARQSAGSLLGLLSSHPPVHCAPPPPPMEDERQKGLHSLSLSSPADGASSCLLHTMFTFHCSMQPRPINIIDSLAPIIISLYLLLQSYLPLSTKDTVFHRGF